MLPHFHIVVTQHFHSIPFGIIAVNNPRNHYFDFLLFTMITGPFCVLTLPVDTGLKFVRKSIILRSVGLFMVYVPLKLYFGLLISCVYYILIVSWCQRKKMKYDHYFLPF
jgi:hypothetical protein